MPKSDFSPVTNKDLKIKEENEGIPVTIISEGSLMKENLTISGLDEKFIQDMLKKAKIKKIKDCGVLTVDEQHNVYIQEKNKNFQFFKGSK